MIGSVACEVEGQQRQKSGNYFLKYNCKLHRVLGDYTPVWADAGDSS